MIRYDVSFYAVLCLIVAFSDPGGQTISTISIQVPTLSDAQLSKFEEWLRLLLWDSTLEPPSGTYLPAHAFAIHRTKGRILTTSGGVKMVQGVREVFEIVDLKESSKKAGHASDWQDGASIIEGKLILIGRGLADQPWDLSLKMFLRL